MLLTLMLFFHFFRSRDLSGMIRLLREGLTLTFLYCRSNSSFSLFVCLFCFIFCILEKYSVLVFGRFYTGYKLPD